MDYDSSWGMLLIKDILLRQGLKPGEWVFLKKKGPLYHLFGGDVNNLL